MAKRERQANSKKSKAADRVRKMIVMDATMGRRLAVLAKWQGRSESAIVCELLRPILADLYLSGVASKTSGEITPPHLADHSEAA